MSEPIEQTTRVQVDLKAAKAGVLRAVSAIIVEHHSDGTADFGVNVLVPVSVPGATETYYKPVGVGTRLTLTERQAIIAALQGKTPDATERDQPGSGQAPQEGSERQGQASVGVDSTDARNGGSR